MANIGTSIYTLLCGNKVGADEFGNKYYKSVKGHRRWVIYKGTDEASKVPAEWHRWLHKTTDDLPVVEQKQKWQKTHLPNLTGTKNAYVPKGHVTRGAKRAKATGDYTAWDPSKSST